MQFVLFAVGTTVFFLKFNVTALVDHCHHVLQLCRQSSRLLGIPGNREPASNRAHLCYRQAHVSHARALLSQSVLTQEAELLALPLPLALSALSRLPMVCVFLWPYVSPLSVSPLLGSVKCLWETCTGARDW